MTSINADRFIIYSCHLLIFSVQRHIIVHYEINRTYNVLLLFCFQLYLHALCLQHLCKCKRRPQIHTHRRTNHLLIESLKSSVAHRKCCWLCVLKLFFAFSKNSMSYKWFERHLISYEHMFMHITHFYRVMRITIGKDNYNKSKYTFLWWKICTSHSHSHVIYYTGGNYGDYDFSIIISFSEVEI